MTRWRRWEEQNLSSGSDPRLILSRGGAKVEVISTLAE